jgi:hypothetical protein
MDQVQGTTLTGNVLEVVRKPTASAYKEAERVTTVEYLEKEVNPSRNDEQEVNPSTNTKLSHPERLSRKRKILSDMMVSEEKSKKKKHTI